MKFMDLLRAGASGAILIVIMLVGSVVLWVGVPIGWLWVGSQVQGSTNSIGTSLAVAMGGALVSIILIAVGLGWLNHKHMELAEARGVDMKGTSALEKVLVVSAGLSVVLFSIWFLLFAGIGPTLAPQ
ncbi:MAG: hypothetical protein H0V29_13115 [Thermoleophilaceae bacterium]|nr:hypothetical protein [Thermoleophilaceae bacterium]